MLGGPESICGMDGNNVVGPIFIQNFPDVAADGDSVRPGLLS
jgi:hypothetical protein